jgi:hypothetical protein
VTAASVRGSALLVVVLAVGIAIGVEFGRVRPPATDAPRSAMDSASMMRTFDRALSLDSGQHAGIATVLGHRQAGIDSAWRTLQPNIRAAMDSTQMEIIGFLNDTQRAKFLALIRGAHGAAAMPAAPKSR